MKELYVNKLKDRITIIQETKTTSNTGEATKGNDVVFKSCRAWHKEVSVNEEEEGKIRALFTDHFIVRYDASLTKGKANAMFVKDNENFKYNIVSVIEIQRKKYLQINTVRRE